ncbi:MAG TPA: carbon-nitrogen hydrolase family protein [Kofleriaceae bacterium]|nr:carbon-nitrogen hydrolase family protein [Kofleriaceae bacterium]
MAKRIIKAAAVQAEPVVLDLAATLDKACRLIAAAADEGARLIVFPELFMTTYVNGSIWGRGLSRFGNRAARDAWTRLWDSSVAIPGAATDRLCDAARRAGAVVAMGLHEQAEQGRTLYNTVLFVGPDGIIGKHRKLVPTNHERMVHGPGDGSTLSVFDTPVGRVGGLICWENFMPLARYALYGQGEQIHVAPTAFDDEMAIVNARNTAFEGGVFVVSVCMVLRKASYPAGFELAEELAAARDVLQAGGSVIVAPDGRVLAGPVYREETILYADLEIGETVEAGQLLDATGHYARPDVLSLDFNRVRQSAVKRSGGLDA